MAEAAAAVSVERPLAVDLFCGRGGWSKALVAAGFQVVGVDVLPQPHYPVGAHATFVQADVRSTRSHELRLPRRPYAVVASPPCQPFSTARPSREAPPIPEGYELVAHGLRLIAELRPRWWCVENVRGAWRWWEPLLGDPDLKDPPYYLWGRLPDAMRPQGPYPSKLRYRDPGKRSEIPQQLARPLAEALRDEWLRTCTRPQRLHAGVQPQTGD